MKKRISTFSSVQDKAAALGFTIDENTLRIINPSYESKAIYVDSIRDLHDTLDIMLYARDLLAS